MTFMNKFNVTDINSIHINSEGNRYCCRSKRMKDVKKNIRIFQIGCAFFYSYIHIIQHNVSQLFFLISDFNECVSSPCVHGTCIDQLHSYTCQCQLGYTGTNCETGQLVLHNTTQLIKIIIIQ